MYYLLKVLNVYPSSYNLSMINKIYTSTPNANLKYIAVDSYEYTGTGQYIFDETPRDRWQTNRYSKFPHYLIFKSDVIINDIFIISSDLTYKPNNYLVKDFELYESPVQLNFTDSNWKLKISETIPIEYCGIAIRYIIPNDLFLIKQNNNYYTIKPEFYETEAKTFMPILLEKRNEPNSSEIELYGFGNIKKLYNFIDIGNEIFRPVDKLYNNFEIKRYALKK